MLCPLFFSLYPRPRSTSLSFSLSLLHFDVVSSSPPRCILTTVISSNLRRNGLRPLRRLPAPHLQADARGCVVSPRGGKPQRGCRVADRFWCVFFFFETLFRSFVLSSPVCTSSPQLFGVAFRRTALAHLPAAPASQPGVNAAWLHDSFAASFLPTLSS